MKSTFLILFLILAAGCNNSSSPSQPLTNKYDDVRSNSEELKGLKFNFVISSPTQAAKLLSWQEDKVMVDGNIGKIAEVLYSGDNRRLACKFVVADGNNLEQARQMILNGNLQVFTHSIRYRHHTQRNSDGAEYYFEIIEWGNPEDLRGVALSCKRHILGKAVKIGEIRKALAPIFSVQIGY